MEAASRIEAEAAEWMVRLHGGTPGLERGLAEWAGRSPVHAACLARAQASWAALGSVDPALMRGPDPVRQGRRVTWCVAVGVAVLAGLGWGLLQGMVPPPGLVATGRGEVRRLSLPDGSQVVLAGESAVVVRFDAGLRLVELVSGEAMFAPAPVGGAERRAFVVEAGGGRSRALGTRFTVGRRADGFEVAVLEHDVEVGLTGTGQHVTLRPQQGLRYDAAGLGPAVAVDAVGAAGWTDGRLVFDRMALAEVVSVLNRYRPGRIVLANGTLGRRRISGVFRAEDAQGALDHIAGEVGARLVRLPFGTVMVF